MSLSLHHRPIFVKTNICIKWFCHTSSTVSSASTKFFVGCQIRSRFGTPFNNVKTCILYRVSFEQRSFQITCFSVFIVGINWGQNEIGWDICFGWSICGVLRMTWTVECVLKRAQSSNCTESKETNFVTVERPICFAVVFKFLNKLRMEELTEIC